MISSDKDLMQLVSNKIRLYDPMKSRIIGEKEVLEKFGVKPNQVIDVQSLIPFDINNEIVNSLMKTNKIIFLDEDVSGGATAYMMQKVLEEQNGYRYLDSKPRTISSKNHRPAYGDEGDYFSK